MVNVVVHPKEDNKVQKMVQVQLIINYKVHATLEESLHHNGNPQGVGNYHFLPYNHFMWKWGNVGFDWKYDIKLVTNKYEGATLRNITF
jgi:hypothetical protein